MQNICMATYKLTYDLNIGINICNFCNIFFVCFLFQLYHRLPYIISLNNSYFRVANPYRFVNRQIFFNFRRSVDYIIYPAYSHRFRYPPLRYACTYSHFRDSRWTFLCLRLGCWLPILSIKITPVQKNKRCSQIFRLSPCIYPINFFYFRNIHTWAYFISML